VTKLFQEEEYDPEDLELKQTLAFFRDKNLRIESFDDPEK
jgi:hypothetical protein